VVVVVVALTLDKVLQDKRAVLEFQAVVVVGRLHQVSMEELVALVQ
jgi:hypothetical protein